MVMTAKLHIHFTSFWVSGTGASRGRHVDVVTHRDRFELPAMPMTQVKGQLRETAMRLASGGHAGWSEARVCELFGSRTEPRADQLPRVDTIAGCVAFHGEARLPDAVRSVLRDDEASRARLFRRLAATRINENGVARDKTLRAIEAAVPMTLEAKISWIGAASPPADWVGWLDQACAATLAFGKLKADGYGRAIAECMA
nr:RAMP superfamily CRISPR-associated protein [uncultured Rhodopila sp.]